MSAAEELLAELSTLLPEARGVIERLIRAMAAGKLDILDLPKEPDLRGDAMTAWLDQRLQAIGA